MPLSAMLLALALVQAGGQTAPADAATACKATDAALPPALAGWNAAQDRLAPGRAVLVDTVDAATLTDLPAGHRPGRAATVSFTVASAGTYGIALDQGGWIDVAPAAGGAPLASASHGHGPACSSIRKIVRFQLTPGNWRLALTGLAGAQARVMLIAG
jgi:hypothetical protein